MCMGIQAYMTYISSLAIVGKNFSLIYKNYV